jgi:hypothetical protein
VREESVTPGSFIGDTIAGAASGGLQGGLTAAAEDVLKPGVIADGTLLGEPHRNALRKDINDLLGTYCRRVFVDGLHQSLQPTDIYKDACVDSSGCLHESR